jgi:hypothetical protein
MNRLASVALCVLVLAACGGDGDAPADATGEYTIALTSGANGCNFENWEEGASTTGIQLVMAEVETGITGTVGGLPALFLDLLQGSHVFAGDVSGNNLLLELFGTKEQVQDGCTHFVNSTLDAELNGDILIGTLTYTIADNGSPECAALAGCESIQNFNGTRPPQ